MEATPTKATPLQVPASMSPTRPEPTSTRQQPSLLPAFEPFSSSPPFNPAKRKLRDLDDEAVEQLPTPFPTSSTGILPSSPPRRPGLQRTLSTLSERAPLGDLPSVVLPANGQTIKFGRSSHSSQYALPHNRHISRVHVTAQYLSAKKTGGRPQLAIHCLGWNGCKVRVCGRVEFLEKGTHWCCMLPGADVMLDVMDCRVMIQWPQIEPEIKRELWGSSPPQRAFPSLDNDVLPSSPPALGPQSPDSPGSPSPAGPVQTSESRSPELLTSDTIIPADKLAVQVFEDETSDHVYGQDEVQANSNENTNGVLQQASMSSLSSASAEGLSDQENENEENDPIVHSFGPFGANLLNRLDSFSHQSPTQHSSQSRAKKPLEETSASPQRTSPVKASSRESLEASRRIQGSPVKNHVINQLAFSRLHAIPLSVIHSNLPAELKACKSDGASSDEDALSQADLNRMLHATPCVGEISREGKDAAGKKLENEFYYVPEMDENAMRRDAVLGSRGGTGLRAVRKNHKQYFWKKPRV